ncbi:hypothetical protein [Actinokineospora sp. NPDC004072]
MIIHIASRTTTDLTAAHTSLYALASSWGHPVNTVTQDAPEPADSSRDNHKAVDPVAIAALILSIPSAALAVTDLTDRILKRRRAKDLIDNAKNAEASGITITVITDGGPRDLASLSPDQLLELQKSYPPRT